MQLDPTGAETVVEIWLDLPIRNSGNESESKSILSSFKQEYSIKPPDVLVEQCFNDKIEKQEGKVVPINIKTEEPLIINESAEVESQKDLPMKCESPPESHEMKLDTATKSSQGCLNDISEIFKDSAPAKIDTPDKIEIVKLKAMPVQPKKTLVRCLDSNGKIVVVELQVDPNNPKNIKIVKTPTVIGTTQPASLSLAKPSNIAQLKISTPVTNVLSNTSNQFIKVNPITSTSSTVNPKPIMYKNLSRFNPVEAKNLLENKKVFIIKSSTLPNLSSTNPPPLVRISNLNKVVLAPSIANLKVVQPTSNVIMKNGKIIVLDKDKSLPKPKQESLLKPQISLLKPVYQKQISESTSAKSILIQKPSSHIIGSRHRKPTMLNQNAAKRDYHKEFHTIFVRHRFQTVRSAVEYVFRNTPLVNTLCSRPEFNAAFPFVAESHEKFSSFPFPKRRLNEVRS